MTSDGARQPTIYLHCGAPKTGTSYLQVIFARYLADLRKAGIVYPLNQFVVGAKDGLITSGNGVEMANYLRPHLPHQITDKDAFIETLEKDLKSSDGVSILFSSEFLVFPDNDRTQRLADIICESGFMVKIIYFVRDYANSAFSSYSQQVKRSCESRPFEDYLAQWSPGYADNLACMEKAFGRDSLYVYNYEEHRHDIANFVFKSILGMPIDVHDRSSVNRSLSPKELELFRIFNCYLGGKNALASDYVNDLLMRITADPQECFMPTPQQHAALSSRFTAEIDLVNSYVRGQPVRVSAGIDSSCNASPIISDFERFVLAVLSGLVRAEAGRASAKQVK